MLAQIVLFDGFDPLDVIAPFEVLSAGAAAVGGRLEVRLVGIDAPGPVTSGTGGLQLTATHVLAPTEPGFVIVPGAAGPVSADPDVVDTIPVLLARVGETGLPGKVRQAFGAPDTVVATVCGGSLALAMAGLLEGRHAVTHHLGNDVLEATGTHLVRARVVDDGDLVSAGGVTSGLDLALHLLDRQFGPQIAHAVEELFEHERRGTVWRPIGSQPLPA
ncbi:DJ-1/PfpI family protein [Modestobacter sp. VKM Ac-2984]|uniref:DJ-1/PfpI family protein n=1 Tax=Modestobacter sp. VKM Ac-2984 TaxID=3004138 RepID=UPI0022AAB586|nr:DJ-1/PfpI family protein [Modestobacter sp. VKM Ac-2984]MCZ2814553.1 DJ-1/PfpI family protein [Modestobacter sp. VKM Ac-2984]